MLGSTQLARDVAPSDTSNVVRTTSSEIMRASNARLQVWLLRPLQRFLVNSLVVWPMLGLYMFINHHQPAPPTTVLMPSWVPFSPQFFPFYFGLLLMTWLLPVGISDGARFRACLRANIYAWLLVMPWWILTPTMLPRPPIPAGSDRAHRP